MQYVFVVDSEGQPLMPCRPARARKLLAAGRAAVYRRYPFTILLKEPIVGEGQPMQIKIDPGSKTTGLAVVVHGKRGAKVVWAAELWHRGEAVKKALDSRRAQRHSRRARHTRYRTPRFDNRCRRSGWLPPSLCSRIDNVSTWVSRLRRYCPITSLSLELVRFDTQLMQNAEISGVQYQQGELQGYEVREYLLDKWQRTCAYCGKQQIPLEIEHLIPKSCGGSNRVSNLTLACHDCNQAKGNLTAEEFGHPELLKQAKQPLRDVSAVNATRWTLYERLQGLGLPLEISTGGRTKFNRTAQHYPKAHWIDAACVGSSGQTVSLSASHVPLVIAATGRGSRQMCRVDRYGFPRTSPKAAKRVFGFQTGDMVKAVIPTGKNVGTYVGRLAVRTTGNFNITTAAGTVQGIAYRHCTRLHPIDGYSYQKVERAIPPRTYRQGFPGAN